MGCQSTVSRAFRLNTMEAKLTLETPTIPRGSTILVTAANGLIASHVVDQFLAAGYRVRGTVRNASKCAWMNALFARRHGPGRFELLEVADFERPGIWDAPLRGVSGLAHVLGAVDLGLQDVDASLDEEMRIHTPLLEAAKREATVKSFVLTSSAWAAYTPNASRKFQLTEWTWNDEAVQVARSDAPPEQKGMMLFMALKTRLEQTFWDWVNKEKPAFNFNTVLLDTVMGECLDPKNQGLPSTAGLVHCAWTGANRGVLTSMQPQWHIDTRDAGMLFVAAMIVPGVEGERIFGFGDRFNWHHVCRILKSLHPDHEMEILPDTGTDQAEVPNQRGEQLLQLLGRPGWTKLEDSVRANAESIKQFEA